MENTNKPIAVIYVRGNRKEEQEMLCMLCATERGYKVSITTDNLDDVECCDVLLATNPSRISRDKFEYHKIVNEFKSKGIKVEYAVEQENWMDKFELVRYLLK